LLIQLLLNCNWHNTGNGSASLSQTVALNTLFALHILQILLTQQLLWFYGYNRSNVEAHFLRATAGTAIARLSHRNSVCPSVCLSVTRVDQAKTVQARIIKSSPSAAPKTLVSGSVTLFQKFNRGHPNRGL